MISEDPALRGPITETVREEVIPRGISAFQNRAAKCPASRRGDEAGGRKTRSLTNEALTRHLHNGETVPWEWILYHCPPETFVALPVKFYQHTAAHL